MIIKLSVISKCVTPQNGKPIITIQILQNISRSNRNEEMKSGRLTDYSVRIFLFKNHTEKGDREVGRLVQEFFFK